MIQQAVAYFARTCTEEENETINTCLEMVRLGMSNTLVQFQGKYYVVGGEVSSWERGLTIGGYESAWFADLVAAYLLETSQDLFNEALYHGIYRDDGIAVFKGNWSEIKICEWLTKLQSKFNLTLNSNALNFTVEMWKPGENYPLKSKINRMVSVNTDMTFPFLDIEFYWDASNFLATRVFLKPNQRIKYLSAHSDHTRSCIKAVPNRVLQRLTKLTSVGSKNIDARIDELYPMHAKAL
jgi:hypothetical protein